MRCGVLVLNSIEPLVRPCLLLGRARSSSTPVKYRDMVYLLIGIANKFFEKPGDMRFEQEDMNVSDLQIELPALHSCLPQYYLWMEQMCNMDNEH